MTTNSQKFEGFTPGPWEVNNMRTSPHIHGPNGEFIASVVSALGMNDVAQPNARLIAAAPELLRLLKQAFEETYVKENRVPELWWEIEKFLFETKEKP